MGEIAARLADLTILTSDNPRSENPAAIRAAIMAAVPAARAGRAATPSDAAVANPSATPRKVRRVDEAIPSATSPSAASGGAF